MKGRAPNFAPIITALFLCLMNAPVPSLANTTQATGHSDAGSSQEARRLNHQGLAHLDKKEYEQAIPLFRQALQLQPDYVDALDNLGKALDAAGKHEEAIGDFDKAIKLAPENAATYYNKGLALFHEGK